MKQWNLEQTYELVKQAFGPEQVQLVRECARSAIDRQNFASYHFTETQRLVKAFERKHLSGLQTILEMHAIGKRDVHAAFERLMVKVGAHSLAAVQSLHAVPDILAHVVYFGTGQQLRLSPIGERRIGVTTVKARVSDLPGFESIHSKLDALTHGPGWLHLEAVSNHGKHRSVVRSALNEDWTGARSTFRELQVSAFERHGRQFESKSLRELLEPEYARLNRLTVDLGNELNRWLLDQIDPERE